MIKALCFSAPRIGGGAHIDPRDTPGYRLHCALSTLNSIDIEHLDPSARERIDTAVTLLEEVNLLTQPNAVGDGDVPGESS